MFGTDAVHCHPPAFYDTSITGDAMFQSEINCPAALLGTSWQMQTLKDGKLARKIKEMGLRMGVIGRVLVYRGQRPGFAPQHILNRHVRAHLPSEQQEKKMRAPGFQSHPQSVSLRLPRNCIKKKGLTVKRPLSLGCFVKAEVPYYT